MANDYVTFLLDLHGRDDNCAILETVAYRRSSRQPENAFVWKVTCDVKGKVIVVGQVDRTPQVIATARWHGALAEHKHRDPTIPNSHQWGLVEAALRAELDRREGMLDRSREEPVSNAQLVEDVAAFERRSQRPATQRDAEHQSEPIATIRERKVRQQRIAIVLGGCAVMAAILIVPMVGTRAEQRERERVREIDELNSAKATARATQTPKVIAAPPDAPAPEEPVEVRIQRAASFAEAIALARPAMSDTTVEIGAGAKQLATYAAAKLVWADVDVPPETTVGHVLKDPAVERGKRMCMDGRIATIERRDLGLRKIYVGTLALTDGDSFAFVAVGSTGELVKRSTARYCGAVTGKSGSAVAMVGMFDLPENRRPIVEQ